MREVLLEMKQEDNENKIRSVVKKIINLHKPEGVSDIEFDLEKIDKDEYYLELTFIVPADSNQLTKNFMDRQMGWGREIKEAIKNYIGIKVIISSVGIRSAEFNLRRK